MAIVGNKKDCEEERKVDFKTLKDYGEEKKIIFSETSAKTGEGIEQMFIDFIRELLKYRNIGIYKTDKVDERTYSGLDKSINPENKHNCNC